MSCWIGQISSTVIQLPGTTVALQWGHDSIISHLSLHSEHYMMWQHGVTCHGNFARLLHTMHEKPFLKLFMTFQLPIFLQLAFSFSRVLMIFLSWSSRWMRDYFVDFSEDSILLISHTTTIIWCGQTNALSFFLEVLFQNPNQNQRIQVFSSSFSGMLSNYFGLSL